MKLKEIKPGMAIKCNTKQEVEFMILELELPRIFMSRWEAVKGDMCFRIHDDGEWLHERTSYYENSPLFEVVPFSSLIIEEKTYEDGLNEAWECAKKIVLNEENGGIQIEEIQKIFGEVMYSNVLKNISPKEAIAKLEAYEAEKQIKVGCIVKGLSSESFGVVARTDKERAYVLWSDGSCGKHSQKDLTKTGKHIDISSILAEIGKE